MHLEFTAVFRPVPEGYVAFVEELYGANTQGATLDEARTSFSKPTGPSPKSTWLAPEVIREPLKLCA